MCPEATSTAPSLCHVDCRVVIAQEYCRNVLKEAGKMFVITYCRGFASTCVFFCSDVGVGLTDDVRLSPYATTCQNRATYRSRG
jgi:hypothetical protein